MTEMKVLVTLNIPEVGIDLLKQEGLQVEVWRDERPLTTQELLEKSRDCQALLATGSNLIDRKFLDQSRHLKIISQFGAGYDNIDVAYARELGISVGNAPDAMSDATADIAFALMLAASRKMCYLHKSVIAGGWGHFKPRAHLGLELKGRVLGIFGMGRIGMEMAKRCKGAYQMDVLYTNRSRNSNAEQLLGAKRVDFDELLNKSDVISVHCALTDQTRGLFDSVAFGKMKGNSLFINTSRGPVHNQKDLYQALVSGNIWGAGLDVTDPEPMAPNDPLLSLENVAITPHIGSATIQARDEMSRLAAKNIIQYHRGEQIDNLVN
jgi:glyoxylate reductase